MCERRDEALKEAVAALVEEYGVAEVVRSLAQICRQKGHSAKYDQADYATSEGWYHAGGALTEVFAKMPTKEDSCRTQS